MINFGIIGYGKMGKIREDIIGNLPNCTVGMICDSVETATNAPFTTDPNNILQNADIDAVCICTPNFMIRDLVVDSLERGKHVLCEKPPGISVAQVADMRRAAERNPSLKLKFGFNHRYHDAIMEAKEQVDSGNYGDILWMRGRYGKSVSNDFIRTWRAKKELAGGGILMDQGIHMLDLFLMFTGNFDEVKSFCSSDYWGLDIEDNVFAMFRNGKGQTASLHSTMTQWRHLFSLEIFLEEGYMVINGILSSTRSYTDNFGKEELTIAKNRTMAPMAKHSREERFMYDKDYSFIREVTEFVNCVENDTPIRIGTLDDAEKLMMLVDKVYRNDTWNSVCSRIDRTATSIERVATRVARTEFVPLI